MWHLIIKFSFGTLSSSSMAAMEQMFSIISLSERYPCLCPLTSLIGLIAHSLGVMLATLKATHRPLTPPMGLLLVLNSSVLWLASLKMIDSEYCECVLARLSINQNCLFLSPKNCVILFRKIQDTKKKYAPKSIIFHGLPI